MFPATEALDILLVPIAKTADQATPHAPAVGEADEQAITSVLNGRNGSSIVAGETSPLVSSATAHHTHSTPTPGLGYDYTKGNIMRIAVVAFTCVVGACLPNFGYITALVGSISNGMLAFVLPPLFYLGLNRTGLSWMDWAGNVALVVVGTIATIGSGTLIAVYGTGASS